MEFKTKRVDEANIEISATLKKEQIEKNLDKVAKEAAKTMNIQGFRKGKVPVNVVKQRYGAKLEEDAQGEAIREVLNGSLKELDLKNSDLVGEPSITKFDKKDSGDIEIEISVATKPNIDLGDYKKLVPAVKVIEVKDKLIDDRIEEIASQSAPLTKIARKRAVKDGDYAVIDFEGFVNDVAFDGGKAEKYPLQVGSNSFIPGFEEQIIGMKYDEEKDITVSFPQEYQAKDLAGKDAIFKVKLHEIQERKAGELDDEFAKQMLPNEKDATMDMLREKIKEQLSATEKATYYREELKPKFIENLVKKINFALPKTVVEQEINFALNNKIRAMSEEEINELREDASKVEKIREELKEEATNSVKATFIVDALAKAENIEVSDQEVSQVLYFEALQMGQNPQNLIKEYQEAGYLPAIKMSIIEEKVISKLFDEKSGK